MIGIKQTRPNARLTTFGQVLLGTGGQGNDYSQNIIIGFNRFSGCFSLAKNQNPSPTRHSGGPARTMFSRAGA